MEVTFQDAWAVVKNIPGWFAEHEGALLHRLATAVPGGRCLVEIGFYRGKTATLLAVTEKPTYLVDPLVGAEDVIAADEFSSKYPNVTFWDETSDTCPDPTEPVGLLHVDGCHLGNWPRRDFERFESLLAEGAFILFHDIDDAKDVRRVVDSLVEDKRLTQIDRAGGLVAYVLGGIDA